MCNWVIFKVFKWKLINIQISCGKLLFVNLYDLNWYTSTMFKLYNNLNWFLPNVCNVLTLKLR